MNHLPDRIEAHCPRCSAPFVISASTRGKRIQCPHCRQTVSAAPSVAPTATSDVVGVSASVTKQAADGEESRRPEAPLAGAPIPPPLGDSVLLPGHRLRWLRRDATSFDDQEQHTILLHNLRAMGRREIAIENVPLDRVSAPLTARLTAIFRDAGWRVNDVQPSSRPRRAHGLVLIAGQCPLPHAATATFMALKAAGFAITPKLDGTLGAEETILAISDVNDDAS